MNKSRKRNNESKSVDKAGKENKSLDQFVLGEKLGEGMFGKVRLGTHILTGEKVAIKLLEKMKILEQADKVRVEREIKILKQLKHNNIIQLYSVIQTSTTIYLVMEYSPGKELFEYIVNKRRLQEGEACEFFQQVVSGVDYMHKNRICHRDLKPENMLLDSNRVLKIIDFGLSNSYGKNELLGTACGSPCYAAPEMIAGNKYIGLKIDIWSIGIILYAMVCGYLPFEDTNNDALYKKILEGKFAIPSFVSDCCKDLIKQILIVDHTKRLTIQDIRNHPWFGISSPNVYEGLLINSIVIPVDEEIVTRLTEFEYTKEDIRCSVLSNKHNNITTAYYLMVKSKMRKSEPSVSDLVSQQYLEFIHNQKNQLSNYDNDINLVVERLASSKEKFIDPNRKEKKHNKKQKEDFDDQKEKETSKEILSKKGIHKQNTFMDVSRKNIVKVELEELDIKRKKLLSPINSKTDDLGRGKIVRSEEKKFTMTYESKKDKLLNFKEYREREVEKEKETEICENAAAKPNKEKEKEKISGKITEETGNNNKLVNSPYSSHEPANELNDAKINTKLIEAPKIQMQVSIDQVLSSKKNKVEKQALNGKRNTLDKKLDITKADSLKLDIKNSSRLKQQDTQNSKNTKANSISVEVIKGAETPNPQDKHDINPQLIIFSKVDSALQKPPICEILANDNNQKGEISTIIKAVNDEVGIEPTLTCCTLNPVITEKAICEMNLKQSSLEENSPPPIVKDSIKETAKIDHEKQVSSKSEAKRKLFGTNPKSNKKTRNALSAMKTEKSIKFGAKTYEQVPEDERIVKLKMKIAQMKKSIKPTTISDLKPSSHAKVRPVTNSVKPLRKNM